MKRWRASLPVAAFFLVGLNLRPALTSLATLLPALQRELSLTDLQLSFLTMLPVLCLGLFGPLAPRLGARLGLTRAVLCLGVVLALGLVLRGSAGLAPLFGGTLLLAAAIGMISVLMPAIARANWPQHVGLMMGLFTMSLCLGAAAGAGLTAPLAAALGTQDALAAWSLAVIPALALCLAVRGSPVTSTMQHGIGMAAMLRQGRAWIVTGFMASQSSLAFVTFGWLPVMLQDCGLSAVAAGSLASLSMLVQAVTALAVPALAAQARSQSLWAIGIMSVTATGFALILLAPTSWAAPGAVVLGLGQGGSFGLALTLIALRSGDSRNAAALSSMVQSIGSLLAALGPFLVGLLRSAGGDGMGGDWAGVLFFLLAMAALAACLGIFAGRPGVVDVIPGRPAAKSIG